MRPTTHRLVACGRARRRLTPAAAFLAACGVALLAACGAGAAQDSSGAADEQSAAGASAGAPAAAAPAPPAADPADVASIDAIIAAVYDVISGPAGEPRDWDRMRSLFVPGARLIPVRVPESGPARAMQLSVEDYIERAGPQLEEGGFFEREVANRTERYGHIAHVFSTYESRRTAEDPEPFARGINSFQLLYDGGRWWIVTIYWDAERPGQPIPDRYLTQG
ncbi:MAG TPA: hypothetical protein VF188_16685 [Longimicrobiales bacterium]